MNAPVKMHTPATTQQPNFPIRNYSEFYRFISPSTVIWLADACMWQEFNRIVFLC